MPTHLFNAGEVLDPDTAKNGPLDVMLGQEEWIGHNRPDDLDWGETPKRPRNPWKRLLFRNLFLISMRLEPQEGTLIEAGNEISDLLKMPRPKASDDPADKAIWIVGSVWARSAPHALGSCGNVMRRLDGVMLAKAQMRVASKAKLETLK